MPGPDEELSFEMPPIRSQQGAAITDRFIVRLKVQPAGAADPE
jgi:hypothetical protein